MASTSAPNAQEDGRDSVWSASACGAAQSAMPETRMANIPDLMAHMADLTDDSVQGVRKTAEEPPRVSVYDVLGAMTGYAPNNCVNLWRRLCESFPEVTTPCSNFKFPGKGQRDTPVTDAEGIITIIMLLPGRAAARARQSAANVVVRYLGGDLSLVREVMQNNQLQDHLEPEHPASLFGQSVRDASASAAVSTNSPQDALEIEMARDARMKTLATAFQLAQSIGSSSQDRLRAEAQRAIDEVLLPQGDALGDYADSASILRERGYTEEQVRRLSGEFGKDLKVVSQSEGRSAQSSGQGFGPDERHVGLYHRVRDAALIEDVLASFRQRALHSRVLAGELDPVAIRRQRVLDRAGRGRRASSASTERATYRDREPAGAQRPA